MMGTMTDDVDDVRDGFECMDPGMAWQMVLLVTAGLCQSNFIFVSVLTNHWSLNIYVILKGEFLLEFWSHKTCFEFYKKKSCYHQKCSWFLFLKLLKIFPYSGCWQIPSLIVEVSGRGQGCLVNDGGPQLSTTCPSNGTFHSSMLNQNVASSNIIGVSFCRAGILAVLRHFFLRRAFVWPNLLT